MKGVLKRPFALGLAAVIALPQAQFLPTQTVQAAGTVIDLNQSSAFSRTKEEIVDRYNASQPTDLSATIYSATGSNASNAYTASALTTNAKNTLLKQTNYYRWLAGMNELTLSTDSTKWDYAAKGAVMLSKSSFSHTPARPSDMQQSFYDDAYKGTSSSSIALTNNSIGQPVMQYTMRQWLNDDDAMNRTMPGHRNTFLTRNASSVAYGFFTDSTGTTTSCQTIIYTSSANPQGSSVMGNNEAAYPWPSAGYFPSEEITPAAPWTITINNDKIYYDEEEDLKIVITDNETGKREMRCYGNGGIMEYTTYWGNTFSFEPPTLDDGSSEYGDRSYDVVVTGFFDSNTNNAVTLSYTVDLFSLFDNDVNSSISNNLTSAGSEVTIYGASDRDSSSLKYYYSYSVDNSAWKTIDNTSGAKSVTFTPQDTGKYVYRIIAKNGSTTVDTRYVGAEVIERFENDSYLSANQIGLGETVTLYGRYKGGDGSDHKYTYSYDSTGTGSSFVKLKENSSDTSCQFTPSSTGTYLIMIGITDTVLKGNTRYTTTYNLQMYLRVVSASSKRLTNTTTITPQTINQGESFTIVPSASGGSGGYKYSFYYIKNGTTTKVTTGFVSQSNGSYKFTPTDAGTYEIGCTVTDSSTTKITVSDTFVVKAVNPLTNISTVSATSVTEGEAVTVNASATGGTSPYTYKTEYKNSTASTWTNLGTGTSMSFKPSEGTYTVRVTVTDNTGKTAEKQFTLTCESAIPTPVNTSTVSTTSITQGEKVIISASAEDGTAPYSYKYEYKKSTAAAWTSFGSGTSAVFKPGAGTFLLKVTVTDSMNKSAEKQFTITCAPAYAPLSNISAVSAESFELGKYITATGNASGGTAPYTYNWEYKKSSASTWNSLGAKKSVNFKPGKAETYNLRCTVTDSNGNSALKSFTVITKNTTGIALSNASTVSAESFNVGQKTVITAAGAGGTQPYSYSFKYKKSSSTSWISFGSGSTAAFKPGKAGYYDLCAVVTDADGKTVEKVFNIVAKNPTGQTLKNTSTVSTTSFTPSSYVTLTASATGGTEPYSYTFEYKKTSSGTWREFGSGTTAKFKPGTTGSYDLKVTVTDADGKMSVKTFVVTSK